MPDDMIDSIIVCIYIYRERESINHINNINSINNIKNMNYIYIYIYI